VVHIRERLYIAHVEQHRNEAFIQRVLPHVFPRDIRNALLCKDGLLPVNQINLEFYGKVAYHDYEGIALDLDEQKRLVADLGTKPVMILRNHGLLTVGKDAQQAFLRMYYLDKACEIQLTAQQGGAALNLPSKEVCEHTERQFNAPQPPSEDGRTLSDPDGYDLAWIALRRLLDRIDPSYKD
jgi:hypothetical protein